MSEIGPEQDDVDDDGDKRTAARKRRLQRIRAARARQRRKEHKDVLGIVGLTWPNVNYLIASKLLTPGDINDPHKVGAAVERALDVLRRSEKIPNGVTY